MLQGPGEEAVGFDGQGGAVELGERGNDIGRPADFGADAADREAALDGEFTGLAEFEFRIDEDERHDRLEGDLLAIDAEVGDAFRVVGDINDGEAEGDSDLRGGEADALGSHHCFEHMVDQLGDFGGHFGDRPAALAEDRVAVLDDIEDHGAAPLVGHDGVKVNAAGRKGAFSCASRLPGGSPGA